ncbi:MAG: hypothetical protein AAF078_09670 [Planctomycetota bacterium]
MASTTDRPRERMIHRPNPSVAAVLTAALLIPTLTSPSSAQRPPVEVSRATTFFTEPLREDGTVDYVAALNGLGGAGPPPEHNAAVALLRLLPDEQIQTEAYANIIDRLSIEVSHDRTRFESMEVADGLAIHGPWEPGSRPEVEACLQRNQDAIDALVAATRRPGYFVPMVRSAESDLLIDVPLQTLGMNRSYSRTLAADAYAAIAESRFDDAIEAMGAVYRLGSVTRSGMVSKLMD